MKLLIACLSMTLVISSCSAPFLLWGKYKFDKQIELCTAQPTACQMKIKTLKGFE